MMWRSPTVFVRHSSSLSQLTRNKYYTAVSSIICVTLATEGRHIFVFCLELNRVLSAKIIVISVKMPDYPTPSAGTINIGRTLAIIKPDAIDKCDEIEEVIQQHGFTILEVG